MPSTWPSRLPRLAHGPRAPSSGYARITLRQFGRVRQLDAPLGRAVERVWRADAGPGTGRRVVDVNSFVGEVCGYRKQGAAYGYTLVFGYHPMLATRATYTRLCTPGCARNRRTSRRGSSASARS